MLASDGLARTDGPGRCILQHACISPAPVRTAGRPSCSFGGRLPGTAVHSDSPSLDRTDLPAPVSSHVPGIRPLTHSSEGPVAVFSHRTFGPARSDGEEYNTSLSIQTGLFPEPNMSENSQLQVAN